ncbi:PAS domain-containing protein [Yunchengibacter salinarum]|uniref:PAS domain-containing protein n=1 Tax=Yunchengibacter salinarum TaxID=3133399 RepID=UPI0035B5C877
MGERIEQDRRAATDAALETGLTGGLRALLIYWKALPRMEGVFAPPRLAVNPRALTPSLTRLTLMERRDRLDISCGLMGTGFAGSWHHPVAGINAFDLIPPPMQENAARFYDALFTHPAGACLSEDRPTPGRKGVRVQSLFLPLTDRLGRVRYLIGCSEFLSRDTGNRLMDQLALDHARLDSVQFLDLGNGVPEISFLTPEESARQPRSSPPQRRWWERFLPTAPGRGGEQDSPTSATGRASGARATSPDGQPDHPRRKGGTGLRWFDA